MQGLNNSALEITLGYFHKYFYRKNAPVVLKETNKVSRATGNVRGITKNKKAEKTLERERLILKGIIESTDTMIAYLDLNFNFIFVNSAYAKASGYSIDELIGKNHFELFPNIENQAIFERVRDTGEPVKFLDKPFEFANQPERGITYWDWTLSTIKNEKGSVHGLVLSLLETTERKKAEEAFKESEERFRSLVESTTDWIWQVDQNVVYTYSSPKIKEILGYNPEEVLGKTPFDFMHKDEAQKIKKIFEEIASKKEAFSAIENWNVHKNGTMVLLETSGVPIVNDEGCLLGYRGIDRDITGRKKAEEALRESEERFRLMADGTPSMLWVSDIDGKNIFVNRFYKEYFRVTSEQANGQKWQPLLHPADSPLYVEKVREALSDHKQFFAQARVRRGDGEWRWIESNATPRFSAQGDFLGFVGISTDITERKKAEDELRESEQRFKLVAEAANVMVYETDVTTGKAEIIRGSQELVGYRPDEIDFTVDWVLSHIHPDDAPKVLAQFKAAAGIGEQENYSIEYRFLHKDGRYIIVKDTAKAVKDSTGKTIRLIGGIRDITQRRKNEERIEQYSKHLEKLVEERTRQLIDSERFVAIGKVAGMVGHDIRNPLQAIVSSTYLAKCELDSLPDSLEKNSAEAEIKQIEEQLAYIDKIVKDLQDYAKPLCPEFSEVDINSLVVSSLATIPIPTNIETSTEIDPSVKKLMLDPMFFKRIIVNLMTNAIQAMPDGGKLSIRGQKRENKALISIEDTGIGIPKDVKAKLFTPMFTTKAKGQGLGLAVVKRLVEAQGGEISVESQEGKGTNFTIEFPLTGRTVLYR